MKLYENQYEKIIKNVCNDKVPKKRFQFRKVDEKIKIMSKRCTQKKIPNKKNPRKYITGGVGRVFISG